MNNKKETSIMEKTANVIKMFTAKELAFKL